MRRGERRSTRARAIALAGLLVLASPRGHAAETPVAAVWSNPISPFVSTGYGYGTRVGSCGGLPKRHTGRDLKASVGQRIRAAANGRIHGTFYERGVGWTILIAHRVPSIGTVIGRYSHVRPRAGYGAGRVVARGEPIARVIDLGTNTHFAFNVYAARYDRWAWRGYLPSKRCGGDPAFPGHFVDPVRFLRIHSDVRAPVTRLIAKPSVRSHRARLTRGRWTVSFACADDRSGCRATQVRVNGGRARAAPRRLIVSGEGRHTISFRSFDYHRNVEVWRGPVTLSIDRTAPRVRIDATTPPMFASSDAVRVDATASDEHAGVHAVRFSICPASTSGSDGCRTVLGARTSNGWSARPPRALPPGTYQAWAVAEDTAGNRRASDRVAFTVLTAAGTLPGA